jgi:hypothetical protein
MKEVAGAAIFFCASTAVPMQAWHHVFIGEKWLYLPWIERSQLLIQEQEDIDLCSGLL